MECVKRIMILLLISILIIKTQNRYNRNQELSFSLVTAIWKMQGKEQIYNQKIKQVAEIVKRGMQIIIFGGKTVKQDIDGIIKENNNVIFIQKSIKQLQTTFLSTLAKKLLDSGKQLTSYNHLTYNKMNLLVQASQNIKLELQHFIWLDLGSWDILSKTKLMETTQIQKILDQYKYFFFLQANYDQKIHAFPDKKDNYFNTKLTIFASSEFFGVKKMFLKSISTIYTDMLTVILSEEYLWSAGSVYSLLMSRNPHLFQLLNIDDKGYAYLTQFLPEEERRIHIIQKPTQYIQFFNIDLNFTEKNSKQFPLDEFKRYRDEFVQNMSQRQWKQFVSFIIGSTTMIIILTLLVRQLKKYIQTQKPLA